MTQERVYNFSPGPSMLATEVLEKAASEMTNYNNTGMSVMELSHRGPIFDKIFNDTKNKLKAVLSVPDTHEILFFQGGATAQFAAVPMNLMGKDGCADYVVTGNFAKIAAKEAAKYGKINIAASSEDNFHTRIPCQSELKLNPSASYFYYCDNNTVHGTEWKYVPETSGTTLVCDMSSNILSRPVDVSKYGVIFAGAQKNIAPAGLTVVIVNKALVGKELDFTPSVWSYKTMIEKDSMLNTPPCYNIYILGLVLDWLSSKGGLLGMEKLREERAKILYDYLDESKLFIPNAHPSARSPMNVTFSTGNAELDLEFSKSAGEHGFISLKGHRAAGGMRASLYNAMPIEGVLELVKYMKEFEAKRHV